MKGRVVAYKRSERSPWMSVPKLSWACAARFFMLATYMYVQYENGTIERKAG